MQPLPGWLAKRARELAAVRVVEVLPPATARSSAIYLLECDGHMELHAVDDAASGIDGCTIALTSREAATMLATLAGALSGRIAGVALREPVAGAAKDV